MTSTLPPAPSPFDRLPYPWFLAAGSLACCCLMLFFFTPRIVLWQGLMLKPPFARSDPEVLRARDTLRQVDAPWIAIATPTNKVLRWRLLFPLLAYYLHLSHKAFLLLPFLGCELVLLFLLHTITRASGDRTHSLLSTAALATTTWFFVSTGWLAYFDSWFFLALLVVSFQPSLVWPGVACVLAPWVDERFLLALPLALLVRACFLAKFTPGPDSGKRDAAVCAALVLPYAIFRLLVLYGGDTDDVAHVSSMPLLHLPLYLEGAWSGLRWLWLFVAGAVLWVWRQQGRKWGAVLVLVGVTILGVNLFLAGDLSRGTTGLLPLGVLGLLVWYRAATARKARWCTAAVLSLNLLTPAEHVVATFRAPIHGFFAEWRSWQDPPPSLRADYYLKIGMISLREGNADQALAALHAAVTLRPHDADALFHRGSARAAVGDIAGALADFAASLQWAPADWDLRPQARERVAMLEAHKAGS